MPQIPQNQVHTESINIDQLHQQYIKNTTKTAEIPLKTISLCKLTNIIAESLNFSSKTVFLKTKVLKHMYDKRPAQEYDFLLRNLVKIVKYPDIIYKNMDHNRGNKCFAKTINNITYFVPLEEVKGLEANYIVTAFKVEEDYIKKFEALWNWEGGYLHRNTLDATN